MKRKNIFPVVASALLVFASAASSQQPMQGDAQPTERRSPPGAVIIQCPVPMNVNLTAPPPTAATPYAPDFPPPPSPPSGIEPNFGGTVIDRHFRHTFTWKPLTECCQYLQGTLTFTYKALSGGKSATSSDAGNDTWVIYKGTSVLASGKVYGSFPFSPGTTGTKTIPLTPAMLTGDRLSFLVQDDTSITSATLNVVACCVRK